MFITLNDQLWLQPVGHVAEHQYITLRKTFTKVTNCALNSQLL